MATRAKQKQKTKRGRRSITDMDKTEVRKEVIELLEDLKRASTEKDPDDQKRIRRSLRRRGHTDGLKKLERSKQ